MIWPTFATQAALRWIEFARARPRSQPATTSLMLGHWKILPGVHVASTKAINCKRWVLEPRWTVQSHKTEAQRAFLLWCVTQDRTLNLSVPIETGPTAWQECTLPLNQQCVRSVCVCVCLHHPSSSAHPCLWELHVSATCRCGHWWVSWSAHVEVIGTAH